jgi:hypothetical protein
MKNKQTPITRLGAIFFAGLISTGAASAATTYSKGGMQTSTGHTQSSYSGDSLPMLAPGVQSFNVRGGLNWDNQTLYYLDISYGYFVTSNVQVGIKGLLVGENSDKSYGLTPFVEYNFLTGTQWVPYVGANVGYINPYGGSHSAEAGVTAGVKYFFRPNIAISAEVGGAWHISGDRGESDGFRKQLTLGTNFYF